MAYVLGYIYADGCLIDDSNFRGKYISVTSVEKENILKIKKWLHAEHRISEKNSTTKNGKMIYTLKIGSHELYKDLTSYGLYPNKSLSVTFPKDIPKEYISHFVRGYLDGDGCVYLGISKGKLQENIVRRLRVIFTSGSKLFLEGLLEILKNYSLLKNGKIYNSHKSFQLVFETIDSIEIFKFLYKESDKDVFLKRKFNKFLDYFYLRPQKVDKEVKNIIELVG